MAHFYLLDDLATTAVGETITLSGAEGRHAATVSRVRVGEVLQVGNGGGLMLVARVVTVDKDSVSLIVTDLRTAIPASPQLILVQALAKNDRDERAIEACTELGIDAIIPWAAERSISRWEGPKVDKGHDRWQAIVREATKQSIRPFVPRVLSYDKAAGIVKNHPDAHFIVLDPTGDMPLSDVDLDSTSIALVVGPEGGITESELAMFRLHGATIARLGQNILRTSTAGPAALAVLNSRLGRL